MFYHFFGGGQISKNLFTKIAQLSTDTVYWWDKENYLGFQSKIRNQLETDRKIIIFFSATKLPCKDEKTSNMNKLIVEIFINFFKDTNNYLDRILVIYFSSDAVYGEDSSFLTEKSPINPHSWYGKMHLTRELLMKKAFEPSLLILRPVAVYGPNDKHKAYGPNRFIAEEREKKTITLFGNGQEKRNHIFIDDLSSNIISLLNLNFRGILNLANSNPISFLEIAEMISDLTSAEIYQAPRLGDYQTSRHVSNETLKFLIKDKYIETQINDAIKHIYRECYLIN